MAREEAPRMPDGEPIGLGDEHYSCVVFADGRTLSRYGDWWLHPWSDDPLSAGDGVCVYVKDIAHQRAIGLSGARLDGQSEAPVVTGHTRHVDFKWENESLVAGMRLEIDSAQLSERRTITLSHHHASEQEYEVVVAMEVALAKGADYLGHPAFSKLFIQTQFDEQKRRVCASRRARQPAERHPTLSLSLDAPIHGYDTDRLQFVGRGRDLADPIGLGTPQVGRCGNVLDPILVLRTRILVPAGSQRQVVATLRLHWPEVPEATEFLPSAVHPVPLADSRALYFMLLWAKHPTVAKRSVLTRHDASMARCTSAAAGDFDGGAFSEDQSEYEMTLLRDASGYWTVPPMPWCNVISNGLMSVIVSERGSLTTTGVNSRLYRLSPWSNDPISDPLAEWLFVKDVQSGQITSLLPGLNTNANRFSVVHGFGYSRFACAVDGLELCTDVSVAHDQPARLVEVVLRNSSQQARHLKCVAGLRWVLGGNAHESHPHLEAIEYQSAIGVRNRRGDFPGRSALLGLVGVHTDFQSDDGFAFWGRHCDEPEGLRRSSLLTELTHAYRAGRWHQTAAIVGTALTLLPGEEKRFAVVLVDEASLDQAKRLWNQFSSLDAVDGERALAREFWRRRVRSTRIKTPDPNLDPLLNGWLRYQTLSCRILGRSAFYQSGGAYGFRDQLQDVAALAQDEPHLLREQLLLNARHQFPEGDVLHWWHHPLPVGIRTRFSDDLVWLPYLLSYYLHLTGDEQILDEPISYVECRALNDREQERFTEVSRSTHQASLYTHAVQALMKACTHGVHGLPLFGCGDWNDGMNRVGVDGRGESVWMAFFLFRAIGDFLPYMQRRQDPNVPQVIRWQRDYQRAVEAHGWDGEWYRRGYYDNGAPLGSRCSDECKIDALAQAWSVLSGLAMPSRQAQALQAMEQMLIDEDHKLIRLLTPPFQQTAQDPGYIKGYVAGIRENGGQYTHAALWVVKALLVAGQRSLAARCLSFLSPLAHTQTSADRDRYKVEPYVIAADVYGCEPHVGRGGWTWYTGSAGWMIRVAIEDLLGFRVVNGAFLELDPKIPDHWPEAAICHHRPDGRRVDVTVLNPQRCAQVIHSITVNGSRVASGRIALSAEFDLDIVVIMGPDRCGR